MERERSDVAYSLLKRRGLTKLVFEGGINHFALGPDEDGDDDDDGLATSTIRELEMHFDLDGQSSYGTQTLTPEQRRTMDILLRKTARLLSRLPQAAEVTLYAPGITCEYTPGAVLLSPRSNYNPSAQVLSAFADEARRFKGKDAEMVVRIQNGDDTVEIAQT